MENLLFEEFKFNNLDQDKQRKVFDIFKQSYEKATGTSWDEHKFRNRADNWLFFGDENGFVTVRPQSGGFYKLTGIAGGIKSILKGLTELQGMNVPVWGMMTPELANILVKRYGYRKPYSLEAKIIMKSIPKSAFGNVDYKMNSDGSVTFSYTDVGEATKFFVANKLYYTKVRILLLQKAKEKFLSPFKKKKIDEEDDIDEARAVKGHYEDALTKVHKFIEKNGWDNSYISFRGTINTTEKNVNNTYNTPTGIYCYPLISYKDKIEDAKDIYTFTISFPYQNDKQYMHTFAIKDYSNVLFMGKNEVEKMNKYVESVKRIYATKDNIVAMCDKYLRGEFEGQYEGHGSYNPTHNFWLFLHNVEEKIKGTDRGLGNNVAILCQKLRIDGFIDDICSSSIHPGEPCQAVFFRLRGIVSDYEVIDAHQNRNDVPVNIETTPRHIDVASQRYHAQEKNWQTYGYSGDTKDLGKSYEPKTFQNDEQKLKKYKKYLSKITNKGIYEIDPDYKQKIYKNKAFWIRDLDDTITFINSAGKDSINGINPDDFDNLGSSGENYRAAYYNVLLNTDRFKKVTRFGVNGLTDHAIASVYYNDGDKVKTKQEIINKEGKPDLKGLNLKKINNAQEFLAIYYNQRLKLPPEKLFSRIYGFGTSGLDANHSFANLMNKNGRIIINKKGQEDITGVNPQTINDENGLAAYYNTINKSNKYSSVQPFNETTYDGKHTVGNLLNGRNIIIDINGNEDIKGAIPEDFKTSEGLTTYFNIKANDNKFSEVYPFGVGISNPKYAIANLSDGGKIIINREGELDVSNLNPNDIQSDRDRIAYISTKMGGISTGLYSIRKFGQNLNNPDRAVALNNDDYLVIIDKDGKENYEGIKISDITGESSDDNILRARILNRELGTNEIHEIYPFGKYISSDSNNTDYAIAKTHYGDIKFINKNGEFDISGINPITITTDSFRAAYYNQKLGKDKFEKVKEFGVDTGNDQRAIAFSNNTGKRLIINLNGDEDYTNISLERIPNELIPKLINQKLGKDVYQHITNFTTDYSPEEKALATTLNNKLVIINSDGNPDISGIDPTKINNLQFIQIYYNQLKGQNIFQFVHPFEGKSTTLAISTNTLTPFFIDKNGDAVDFAEIDNVDETNSAELAAYYNAKMGNDLYRKVFPFNSDNITKEYSVGIDKDDKYHFINKAGEPALGLIDPSMIESENIRARYINALIGKDKYSIVNDFNIANGNIAIAINDMGKKSFINKQGKPDIKGIDPMELDGYGKAVYFNTISKNPNLSFKYVNDFGDYTGNPERAYAKLIDNSFVIVNKKGQKDISDLDMNYIYEDAGNEIRAAYFNQLLGEKMFTDVRPFGSFSSNEPNIALAKLVTGSSTLINKEGKLDIGNIKPEDLGSDYLHIYYNAKLGKNIYSRVYSMGNHVGSPERSLGQIANGDSDHNNFRIIDSEGVPNIEDVDMDAIKNDEVRAAYFNQLLGTDKFRTVDSFSSDGTATAYMVGSGKDYKINKSGEFINKDDVSGIGENVSIDKMIEEEILHTKTQELKEKMLQPY